MQVSTFIDRIGDVLQEDFTYAVLWTKAELVRYLRDTLREFSAKTLIADKQDIRIVDSSGEADMPKDFNELYYALYDHKWMDIVDFPDLDFVLDGWSIGTTGTPEVATVMGSGDNAKAKIVPAPASPADVSYGVENEFKLIETPEGTQAEWELTVTNGVGGVTLTGETGTTPKFKLIRAWNKWIYVTIEDTGEMHFNEKSVLRNSTFADYTGALNDATSDDFDYWTNSSNIDDVKASALARRDGGDPYLRIHVRMESKTNVGYIYQNIYLPEGTEWTIDIETKGDGTNCLYYAVYDMDNTAYVIGSTSTGVTTTATWTRHTANFTVPSGCERLQIQLISPLAVGYGEARDVRVYEQSLSPDVFVLADESNDQDYLVYTTSAGTTIQMQNATYGGVQAAERDGTRISIDTNYGAIFDAYVSSADDDDQISFWVSGFVGGVIYAREAEDMLYLWYKGSIPDIEGLESEIWLNEGLIPILMHGVLARAYRKEGDGRDLNKARLLDQVFDLECRTLKQLFQRR